jgi:beta-xylosidase
MLKTRSAALRWTPTAFISLCLLVAPVAGAQPLITQYQNPLDVSIADPQILHDGGTYYLYGTSYDPGFGVFTSTDMVNWRRRGVVWHPTATSWAQSDFWAPEVVKSGNTFYLFLHRAKHRLRPAKHLRSQLRLAAWSVR